LPLKWGFPLKLAKSLTARSKALAKIKGSPNSIPLQKSLACREGGKESLPPWCGKGRLAWVYSPSADGENGQSRAGKKRKRGSLRSRGEGEVLAESKGPSRTRGEKCLRGIEGYPFGERWQSNPSLKILGNGRP